MSNRWFRFYDEALDDPKVQMLEPQLFKAWVNILCLANRYGGAIPLDKESLSFSLRVDAEQCSRLIEQLQEKGLIDRNGERDLVPHNWSKRQYVSDNSSERVKRFRDKKKKQNQSYTDPISGNASSKKTCNADVTLHVTEAETPPDTEQNRTEADTEKSLLSVSALPKQTKRGLKKNKKVEYSKRFELAWAQFPSHPNSSKLKAWEAWNKLIDEDQTDCLDGTDLYARWFEEEKVKRSKDPPMACHLATFINQRRWEALIEAEEKNNAKFYNTAYA